MTTLNSRGLTTSGAAQPSAARVVSGAAIGLMGSFPALFFGTLSVFLKPIAGEFGWGRAQTAGATVLSNLGIAFGAILVGRLVDRFGAHRVIPWSAALMAVAIAALGLIPNSPLLLAALSFTIGLVGVGTTPLGYLSVLPRYFDKRLGLAFGLAMAGMGVGTVLMPMVSQQLISAVGWRMAYTGMAAMALLCALLAWVLLFGARRARYVAEGARAASPDTQLAGMALGQAAGDTRFWLLLLTVMAVAAAALGFSVHGVSIMTDRGIDAGAAARVAGLAAAGVVVGRLFGGALMDWAGAVPVACVSFAIGGAGLWIFATDSSQDIALLTLAAFMASFAIGAEGDFIPLAVRRYFGLKAFGAIYGVMFFAYATGGVLGPVAMGLYFDRMGDYRAVLRIAATACIVCGAALVLLGRQRYTAARKGT
jgi:MFS family permease